MQREKLKQTTSLPSLYFIGLLYSDNILQYKSRTKRWLVNMATSRPITDCPIRHVDTFRQCDFQLFCKKLPQQNQLAGSSQYLKEIIIFNGINPRSNLPSLEKFANKTLRVHKINPSFWFSLRNYFRKTLGFSLNQTTTGCIR